MNVTTATRRLEWDSGHRVPLHGGRCRYPHGHRYAAEVTVSAPRLTREGFVFDFGSIKERIGAWIAERWDHRTLAEVGDEVALATERAAHAAGLPGAVYWLDAPPTAETLARELVHLAVCLLPEVSVVNVRVYETPNCWADFGPLQ